METNATTFWHLPTPRCLAFASLTLLLQIIEILTVSRIRVPLVIFSVEISFLSCFGSEGPRVLFGICPRKYWLDHWNLKESESEFIEYHVINQIACYLQHGDVNDRKRMNTKNNVTLNSSAIHSHPIHPTFWSAALRLIIIIVQWWWHASVGTESNANYHGYSTPLGQRGGCVHIQGVANV